MDGFFPIEAVSQRILCKNAGIGTKTQGAADILHPVLIGHQIDDRMGGGRIQFYAVRVGESEHISGKLHDGKLHAQAQAEIGDIVGSGVGNGINLSVDAPVAESAGNQNSVHVGEKPVRIFRSYFFRIHPFDPDTDMIGNTAVLERFHHADIGVMKLNIFAYQSNRYLVLRGAQRFHHGLPVGQIRLPVFQSEAVADHIRQMFFFHGERRFIQIFHIQILQNTAAGNVTEQSDFILNALAERNFAAADDDIGLDSHSLKLLNAGLGGFGFQFLGGAQIGNQGDVDQNRIFMSDLSLKLADGFQKRLAFDISYGAAHFDDGDPCFIVGKIAVETALDLVGDVRDDLNGTAAVISAPFLLENGPVNLSGGDVGIPVQIFIDETLIMAKVQIGFRSILGDEYLSVLDGIHGSGINVDIRIKFLHGHLIAPGFQKPPQRGRRDSLAKAGNHAACYEYILYCHSVLQSAASVTRGLLHL